MALAPFVAVAARFVGAGHIIGGGQGFDAGHGATLTGNLVARKCFRVPAHLPHDGTLIADQPFVVDLVGDGVAVGHDAVGQLFTGGRAIGPIPQMGGSGQKPVR